MKRFLLLLPLIVLFGACYHPIEAGLSEREARDCVVTLRESGIYATSEAEPGTSNKEASLWVVKIQGGEEETVKAWKVLREHGLPPEKVLTLDDVFKNSGMIPTSTEEKARLIVGLSGELTKTLRSVPGVVEARVHPVLPDNTNLIEKKDQNATTASVLVRYRGEHSPLTDEEVRELVAKGVEGLTPSNVAVVQKQATEKPLPPEQTVGPLNGGQWMVVSALSLSGISSIGALTMLVLSKRRALRIKMLERQLSQLGAASGPRLAGEAKA